MRYLEYDLTRFSTAREKNDGRSIATNAKFLRRKEQKNLSMRLRQEILNESLILAQDERWRRA
jgi:hypothetical protein